MKIPSQFSRWLLVTALAVVSLVAAACAVSAPAPAPQAQEPAAPPEAPAAPGAETSTLFVGPNRLPCTGVAPRMCLQVKDSPDAEYGLFYDEIAGFEFEAGYEYELTVQREKRENVPADASAFTYTLVEVVSKTPVASTAELEGTVWQVIALADSQGQLVMPAPNSEAGVTFQDGQLGGNATCNTYFGSYTVDGNTLAITMGGMTMMACPEPLMAQEQLFVTNLQSAATYEITADQLHIRNADGATVLVFAPLLPTPLTGTNWVAMNYNNGRQAVVSVLGGTEITAVFGEDGSLTGSAGCNNYMTKYQVDGNAITIEPAATTRMLCAEPEGVMEQEAEYLAALTTASTYEIRGDKLELRTADGALVASFVAQAEPTAEAPAEPTTPAEGEGEATNIFGVLWQWTGTTYGDGSTLAVDDPTRYTLLLQADGALEVQADCNRGAGSYTVDGNSLTLGPIAVTLMACAPDSLDTQFLQELGSVVSYVTDGPDLILNLEADSGNMRFSAAPAAAQAEEGAAAPAETPAAAPPEQGAAAEAPAEAPNILNTIWLWEGTTTPAEEVTAADPANYRFALLPGGLVRAQADCNQARGTYTLEGNKLTIQVTALTRAACPPGSQAELFLTQLNSAAVYFVQDGKLFVDLVADGGTMRFTPRAAGQ